MQTLSILKREWNAWRPAMMWDACIAEVAIGTVAAVQLTVSAMIDTAEVRSGKLGSKKLLLKINYALSASGKGGGSENQEA